jgi:hypothetical protein
MTGDVSLGDNVKAKFGASDDLQIYHDGSHSYIKENGTGQLFVEGTELRLRDSAGVNYFGGNTGAEAFISYAGSTKLATTSTGVDVTGSVTCDGFTSTGIDDNATSTAITIDASENVGIGTSSPGVNLHVKSASYPYLRVTNDGYTGLDIGQADSGAGGAGLIKLRDSAPMMFYTADLERMRINSTGDVTVKTGNLVIGTSGKGIDFSATSDGSGTMTSEVLDDYETGTWTPTIISGAPGTPVYTASNVGRYTKVGDTVHLQGRLTWTSLGGGTGTTSIGGLPFTPQGGTGILGTLVVGQATSLAITAGSNICGYTVPTSTTIRVQNWDSTNGTSSLTHIEMTSSGDISFAISYTA